MSQREDFAAILVATLERAWSRELDVAVRVIPGTGRQGSQAWCYQPAFSAYHVPDVEPAARRFLREALQFTPVHWRLPLQWTYANLAASGPGLRLLGRAGFSVEPGLERAHARLVQPGNQRIRTFDFERGTTRVYLKAGFDPAGLRREIDLRGGLELGPFPRITESGEDWFEEAIFDGFALPRAPPWFDRAGLAARALALLDGWLDRTERPAVAADHAREVSRQLVEALAGLPLAVQARKVLQDAAGGFVTLATGLGAVPLAIGHGDMQPGNVLVSRTQQDVTIIDWEHSRLRFRFYDRMVWGLEARSPRGLTGRVAAFVAGDTPASLAALPVETSWRRGATALFLLEDMLWFARESQAGPYKGVSGGLVFRASEVGALLSAVGAVP